MQDNEHYISNITIIDGVLSTFVTAYEEDGDGNDPTPDPVPTPTPDKPKDRTFTQEDLDRIVQERISREQKTKQELLNQVQELQKTATMTDEMRSALNKRVAEISNELKSTEQRAKEEIETLKQENERIAREKAEEVTRWQQTHTNYRIQNELLLAAEAHDARKPEQLVKLLREDAEMVPVIGEDGKPTGDYEVQVTVRGTNDKGEEYIVKRKPFDAVALLREMPENWGNQFNAKGHDGIDLMTNQSVIASRTNTGLVTDKGYAAYKESREKNKQMLGIRDGKGGSVRTGR